MDSPNLVHDLLANALALRHIASTYVWPVVRTALLVVSPFVIVLMVLRGAKSADSEQSA